MNESSPTNTPGRAMKLSRRITGHPWSAYLCMSVGICVLISGLDGEGQVMGIIRGSVFDLTLGRLAVIGVVACLAMLLLKVCLPDPDPPVSAKYRRVVLRVAGFMVFLGVLQLLASVFYPAVRQAQNSTTGQRIQQEQVWVSRMIGDVPFQVQVPEHWKPVTNAGEVGSSRLFLGDGDTNLYFNIVATAKQSVEITRLEELATANSTSMTKTPDTTMTDFEYASANSLRIATATSRSLSDGVEYDYWIRVIDGGNYWIELMAWSTPGQMELYAPTFDRVFGSVEPILPSGP